MDVSKVGKTHVFVGALAIFFWMYFTADYTDQPIKTSVDYDPCCEFPCQHQGVCLSLSDKSYVCDCTNTGHYGINCTTPTWSAWLVKKIQPDPEMLHTWLTTDWWLWTLINSVPALNDMAMKYIFLSRGDQVDSPVRFESDHSYTTLDAYFNETYYARTLPPVPLHCPTPMGVVGNPDYPDVDELIEKVFKRKKFLPEPHGTNLLFQYYAQHFTHQFFRTNYTMGPQFTKGNGGVDSSNIYGLTENHRRNIRLYKDGKLKYREVNGEHFPPMLKEVPSLDMEYPPQLPVPEESKHALGHPFYALLPGLFAYSTIWLREHNRVCDVLKEEHPHWDDERLYHTAKLIITGEVIKITIEDYVQHLSQYKLHIRFRPHVVHGSRFQFHNRINIEFDHMYHWHPLVPDGLTINDTYYDLREMAFSVKPIFTHGLDAFIHALNTNQAGKMGPHNHGHVNIPILRKMLLNSRKMRFQGINAYRKRFKMSPFKSFEDLTGDQELADILRGLYGHINAVEFFVGLFTERSGPSLTALTIVNTGGPWSVKGLIANPICSPMYWKPSTFGGEKGFEIVNTASLEKLFCKNMKSKCQDIGMSVPRPK
ncbi:hypothetical protein FHG87_012701 [Trinorchestia longiramus]|nr:hypothetical protein FHG87_012701 [Trinorchestia longiramus]